MKTSNGNGSMMPDHIESEDMISYLDGEMSSDRHSETQAHLESCWECRGRLNDVERAIDNFLEIRQTHLVPPVLPPSDPELALFRERLSQHQQLTPARSLLRSAMARFRQCGQAIKAALNVGDYSLRTQIVVTRSVALVAIAGVVVSIVLFSGKFNTVSASELLRRTMNAQQEQIEDVSQPVLHQRIQVTRLGSNGAYGVWEIWNDTVNSRVRSVGTSPVVTDLQSILKDNHMNEHRPLAASSYKAWADSLSSHSDTVGSEGENLTIKTTTATATPGSITEALYSVRDGDYHANGLHITVPVAGGVEEYQLAEQDYQVVSLKSVDPSIFSDPRQLQVASKVGTKQSQDAEPAPSSDIETANSNTSSSSLNTVATANDEIDVLDRLHSIGADISEQLTVTRTADGHLLIEGLVETPDRKQQILNALAPVANNPAIRIKVQTIEEATNALRKRSKQVEQGVTEQVDIEKGSIPVDADLRAYFSKPGGNVDAAIRDYATKVIRNSESAVFQASALNRMANRFTPDQLAKLAPAERSKWLGMLREYATAVRRETVALRGSLQLVFGGSETAVSETVTSDADLIASARKLYELASSNDRSVRAAFTLSSGGNASTVKSPQFRHALAEVEAVASAIASTR